MEENDRLQLSRPPLHKQQSVGKGHHVSQHRESNYFGLTPIQIIDV